MRIKEVMQSGKVDFTGIESSYFLVGLLSAFDNRFQAMADRSIEEISWKQFFAIICINLCKESPTIKELADIMGSSHQNVKQILLKLEKKGFVRIVKDEIDRRKQRVEVTKECFDFCKKNEDRNQRIMSQMFCDITEEQLRTTIQTIVQIEENLKAVEENQYEDNNNI